jgi:hypothetical protein
MAEMSEYCRAYPADELRRFPGWYEMTSPLIVKVPQDAESGTLPLSGRAEKEVSYFFVHENFTVTAGIYRDQNVVFREPSPAWTEFCTDVLKFLPETR